MIHFKNTNTQHGFTIVELVVIIVVIGILASIGVIGYGSWRQRVAVNEVTSDLKNAVAAMDSARNFSNGYPLTMPTSFTASPGVTFTYISGDTTNFCIEATSKSVTTITYFVKSSDNIKEPRRGTCAGGVYVEPLLPNGGVVTTLAGSGSAGYVDGTGSAAKFSVNLDFVAVDSAGNVYVTDYSNYRIRKITPAGVVTTLAGSGSYSDVDGTGSGASFRGPTGIAVDSAGTVYVADNGNRIRKITPAGVVTTLAGSGTAAFADGTGSGASFYSPQGIAVDSAGTVYVVDSGNQRIRKITPAGVVTTLAGSGTAALVDGTGSGASFNSPTGIAVDSAGIVYVANRHSIRKITPAGVVTTLAGSGSGGSPYADGTGSGATIGAAEGVAVDSAGTVYFADRNALSIRKMQ